MTAAQASWATIPIDDVPQDDVPVIETQAEDPGAGQLVPTEPAGLDAGGTPPETQEEEDQEAWRNFRVSPHAGENHKFLNEIVEQEPAFKRALNTLIAARARADIERNRTTYETKMKQLEEDNLLLKQAVGDNVFGQMSPEQLGNYVRNPRGRQIYEDYQQTKQQVANPPPSAPGWVTTMFATCEDMLDQASLHLPDNIIEGFRASIRSPKIYEYYANNPVAMRDELHARLSAYIDGAQTPRNNARVQAGATQPAPAASAGRQIAAPTVQGNRNLARQAPDTTPRNGGQGRPSRVYTDADMAEMDPDKYDELLKAHGAKSFSDLRKAGVLRD